MSDVNLRRGYPGMFLGTKILEKGIDAMPRAAEPAKVDAALGQAIAAEHASRWSRWRGWNPNQNESQLKAQVLGAIYKQLGFQIEPTPDDLQKWQKALDTRSPFVASIANTSAKAMAIPRDELLERAGRVAAERLHEAHYIDYALGLTGNGPRESLIDLSWASAHVAERSLALSAARAKVVATALMDGVGYPKDADGMTSEKIEAASTRFLAFAQELADAFVKHGTPPQGPMTRSAYEALSRSCGTDWLPKAGPISSAFGYELALVVAGLQAVLGLRSAQSVVEVPDGAALDVKDGRASLTVPAAYNDRERWELTINGVASKPEESVRTGIERFSYDDPPISIYGLRVTRDAPPGARVEMRYAGATVRRVDVT